MLVDGDVFKVSGGTGSGAWRIRAQPGALTLTVTVTAGTLRAAELTAHEMAASIS